MAAYLLFRFLEKIYLLLRSTLRLRHSFYYHSSDVAASSGAVFTARCYACAVLAMALCPCLSVTSRSFTKTAEHRITQRKPHDSSGSLVFFDAEDLREILPGQPVLGRQMQVRWVKIGDFRQICYLSKTVKNKTHSFY